MTLPHREGHDGAATPEQMAKGRRYLTRRNRWAPHTNSQAWADFEAAQQADEDRQNYLGGNRG